MAITRATFPLPDVDDPLVAPFFAAAARDELAIARCAACGRYLWYPAARCPGCESDRIEWVPVRGDGTLFTWVVVRHAFLPAFESMVPFVTALVALDDDPAVRLCSYLLGADGAPADPDGSLTVGAPVQVAFRDLAFATVPDHRVRVPYFQLRT
jgi:uncharacterized OB-fold protein